MSPKGKLIIVASILLLLLLAFLLFHRKEIIITGFAYKTDDITIKMAGADLLDLKKNCNSSPKGLCSFYEKVKLTNYWDNKEFTIKVDSAKITLLDTVITISSNITKPIISFQDPNETEFKRVVFVVDENDERIIIP